jgi:hypothetical protein
MRSTMEKMCLWKQKDLRAWREETLTAYPDDVDHQGRCNRATKSSNHKRHLLPRRKDNNARRINKSTQGSRHIRMRVARCPIASTIRCTKTRKLPPTRTFRCGLCAEASRFLTREVSTNTLTKGTQSFCPASPFHHQHDCDLPRYLYLVRNHSSSLFTCS